MKKKAWPAIRERTNATGTVSWCVDPGKKLGKRERFFFATEAEAKAKADALRVRLKNEGTSSAQLTDKERADAAEAVRKLRPFGVTLLEAVDYYVANARPKGGTRTIRETLTEMLVAKRHAGRRESYLEIQEYTLGNVFCTDFGTRQIHELAATEIYQWMNGKPWTIRTRLNYFTSLRNLFGFAVRQGYRASNPIEQIEKPIVTETSPGVLTVDQAKALLTVCAEGAGEMLPAVAIALFAGLRTEELDQLDWKHVDLREKNIHVPPEIAKTREGRDVEIVGPLAEWLAPFAAAEGKLAPAKSYDWRLSKKATTAGITNWPKNALRHSFASYHFAHFRNAPLTAAMLGHSGSTQTFEKRYKRRVKPSEAAKYWALKPAS